jgi:hypothetical protein
MRLQKPPTPPGMLLTCWTGFSATPLLGRGGGGGGYVYKLCSLSSPVLACVLHVLHSSTLPCPSREEGEGRGEGKERSQLGGRERGEKESGLKGVRGSGGEEKKREMDGREKRGRKGKAKRKKGEKREGEEEKGKTMRTEEKYDGEKD